ncbi:unnamed protein product [Ilex paraguariensis]|uniref:Uncharacterized protein n=1 Tax=Ilex paraguariensis TaxID=185542 RepID=A0ABC8SF72_9AQUA
MDKKSFTPKSLQKSINFASRASESSKTSSPIPHNVGNSRIIKAFIKTSKYGSTQQTPTRVLTSPSLPSTYPQTFVDPRKTDNATPNNMMTAKVSMEKKSSTPKSLHMSINFASRANETNKTSSPLIHNIGNSRIVKAFDKTSKDSSTQQTPTRASVNGVSKHPSVTHLAECRRSKALLDQFLETECWVGNHIPYL